MTTDPELFTASNPQSPPEELARIAAERADLHAVLAANPATYPELLVWLSNSPDPLVQQALAQRAARQSAQSAAPPPPVPTPQSPPAPPAAAYAAPAPVHPLPPTGTEVPEVAQPARKQKRSPWLAVGIVSAVLALVAAAGGFAYVQGWMGGGGAATPVLANSWSKGAEQAWTVQEAGYIPAASPDGRTLILDLSGRELALSLYELSSDSAERAWGPIFADDPDMPSWAATMILRDAVFWGDSKYDAATGELLQSGLPWDPEGILYPVTQDNFVAAEFDPARGGYELTGYTAGLDASWEIQTTGYSNARWVGWHVVDFLLETEDGLVIADAKTGAVTDVPFAPSRLGDVDYVGVASDGWIIFLGDGEGESFGAIGVYPDGTVTEQLTRAGDGTESDWGYFARTPGEPLRVADVLTEFKQNQNPQQGQFTANLVFPECDGLELASGTISLGATNPCSYYAGTSTSLISISPNGNTALFRDLPQALGGDAVGEAESISPATLVDVKNGRIIWSAPSVSEWSYAQVLYPELILISDDTSMTAWRPAK